MTRRDPNYQFFSSTTPPKVPPLSLEEAIFTDWADARKATEPHDLRRLYVTSTLQEMRAALDNRYRHGTFPHRSTLDLVDDYIRQIEEFLESTAPGGTEAP